jgi:hypothetical protein
LRHGNFQLGGNSIRSSLLGRSPHCFNDVGMRMSDDQGSPGSNIVYVGIAILINQAAPSRLLYKNRVHPHSTGRTHGAVHSPGDPLACFLVKPFGFFPLHDVFPLQSFMKKAHGS